MKGSIYETRISNSKDSHVINDKYTPSKLEIRPIRKSILRKVLRLENKWITLRSIHTSISLYRKNNQRVSLYVDQFYIVEGHEQLIHKFPDGLKRVQSLIDTTY